MLLCYIDQDNEDRVQHWGTKQEKSEALYVVCIDRCLYFLQLNIPSISIISWWNRVKAYELFMIFLLAIPTNSANVHQFSPKVELYSKFPSPQCSHPNVRGLASLFLTRALKAPRHFVAARGGSPPTGILNQTWLENPRTESGWWFQSPWKIWKSIGMIIPKIWENKKYSKPPTSFTTSFNMCSEENHLYIFIFLWSMFQQAMFDDTGR